MRKTYLALVLGLALALCPVLALAGSWLDGESYIYGETGVWGAGEAVLSGYSEVTGNAYSKTGGCEIETVSGFGGDMYHNGSGVVVIANHGSGVAGAGTYGGAFANEWGTGSYAEAYMDVYTYTTTSGNAKAEMGAGGYSYADAWNY